MRIYVQVTEEQLVPKEREELQAFREEMKKKGHELLVQEQFSLQELPEVQGTQMEMPMVALCQKQQEAEHFVLRNIPVVSYEPKIVEGTLEHPKVKYVLLSLEGAEEAFLEKVWRRYFGLPLFIMETERTRIRELSMEDMEILFHLYEGEGITDYIEPLFPREEEIQYQRDYIEKVYGFYEYGMWLVEERATGEIIGRAGLESRDPEHPEDVELGYVIRRDRQRQGYATEVCAAIMEYAREQLGSASVSARVNPENLPSVKVVERLGMCPVTEKPEAGGEILYKIWL